MKDRQPTDYLRLAMDASSDLFAWHFFGVVQATHESDFDNTAPDPQTVAREYLETFYPEALEQAEGISLETQTLGN